MQSGNYVLETCISVSDVLHTASASPPARDSLKEKKNTARKALLITAAPPLRYQKGGRGEGRAVITPPHASGPEHAWVLPVGVSAGSPIPPMPHRRRWYRRCRCHPCRRSVDTATAAAATTAGRCSFRGTPNRVFFSAITDISARI